MRILFCNYEYPPLGGGGGVINKQVAEELAKKHEVSVLTSQGMDLPYETEENGVMVYRVPVFFRSRQAAANFPSMFAYLPSAYYKGKSLIREKNFDVINTHFVVPTGPVGDWLSRYGNIPNVLSVHGGDLYDPSKWTSPHRHGFLRNAVRKLLRKADRVVGQSSNTIHNVHEYYDPDLACDCVPLAILRPDSNRVAQRAQYGLAQDDVLFVTVGRLVSRKAVDQLVQMIAKLNNAKAKLLIIGSGPQQENLQRQAAELNISSQILFLGQVAEHEKFEILRMADIYASTSQHEGFGIVYLEGMACNLPIVCYDYGGQTDFLSNEVNGFVVKLNDTDAFGESCQRLIEDKTLRANMAAHNLRAVEEFYIDRCAQRYEDIFNQAIAAYRGRNN